MVPMESVNVSDNVPQVVVKDKDGNIKPPGAPVEVKAEEVDINVSFQLRKDVDDILNLVVKNSNSDKNILIRDLMVQGLGIQLARQRELSRLQQKRSLEVAERQKRDLQLKRDRKARRKAQRAARKKNR